MGIVQGLRPDGKTQVTVGYDGYTPVELQSVVISTQHDPIEPPGLGGFN